MEGTQLEHILQAQLVRSQSIGKSHYYLRNVRGQCFSYIWLIFSWFMFIMSWKSCQCIFFVCCANMDWTQVYCNQSLGIKEKRDLLMLRIKNSCDPLSNV